MARGGVYAQLMAEQVQDSSGPRASSALMSMSERDARGPEDYVPRKNLTEGIIKAEGLTWYQVVAALMKVILPWKGKLPATFTFGVLRVIAFIGVGVLSALIVLALKHHEPYAGYAIALAVTAPLSGALHSLASWMAHAMAFP